MAGTKLSAHQHICTECGGPFTSSTVSSTTCSDACRKRRERRKKRQGEGFTEYDVDISATAAAMANARDQALDDLPAIAREVLAEELRPAVREALSGDVLTAIGDMMGLLPRVQESLKQDLLAWRPLVNPETGAHERNPDGELEWEVDEGRRKHAQALVLKYTVGQPGLAPQPDAPEAAGITVVFSGMGEPAVTSSAVDLGEERLAELESGESRQCDICEAVKPSDEFVGASSRCEECQGKLRNRVNETVAAMEARTT